MTNSSFLKKLAAALVLALVGLATASAQFTTQAIPGGVRITAYTGNSSTVVIPLAISGDAVLEIGTGAFQNQDTITTLTLPTSLITIGANAFRDCDNLGSVFIPASVTSIGVGAFAACDRLASILVDITNPNYISEDGVLYDIDTSDPDAILHQYPAGRPGNSFAIPAALADGGEPVITIAERAFEEAQNLLSMEFTNNVATIGSNAFLNAPRLARVTFDPQVTSIGASSFNGTSSLAFATFIGDAPTTFGATVFAGASAGFEVRYVQGATGFSAPTWTPSVGQTYNSRTIQTTGVLTYRVVGSGVEILSPEPGVLAPILIDETIAGLPVRGIGNAAFTGSAIPIITLPNSLNTIGTSAFEGSALTFVDIPAGVSSIGTGAFAGCSNLGAFIVNSFNQYFSSSVDGVLFNKNKTTLVAYPPLAPASSYTLPSTVATVAQRAFEGNAGLVSVIFPDSVVTIQDRAFYNSAQLVWAYFGIKVNSIGAEAFSGTNSVLNNVYFFGSAPNTVGSNAFPKDQQPFEVLYLKGATGFPASPGGLWNGYTAKPFEKFDDFTFTVLDNNTVEIIGYTGTAPGRGGAPDVRIDFTTLPDPQRSVASQAARLALQYNEVELGEYILQIDNFTLYVVDKITEPKTNDDGDITSPGKVDYKVVNTDGQQLQINTNTALGSTVLVQDDVGPIIWQKVSFPGTNASDWISVNFGLPNTIAGKPVTSIADSAFAGNPDMVSVVLPTSLTNIGANAFKGCSALGNMNSSYTGVFIPASVITIGEGAFAECEYLDNIFVHPNSANYSSLDGVLFNKDQSILHSFPTGRPRVTYELPATVNTIADQAFEGNQWLVALTLSDSVKTIGYRAFANAQSLVQITIGKGIEEIGDEAFKDALVLGSAVFNGNAPETIGSNMFDGTADPFEIEYFSGYTGFDPKPPAWSTYDLSSLLTSGDFVFTTSNGTATIKGYVGTGGVVTIPSKFGQLAVRKIGKEAFLGKQGITSVRIPDSVSSIDEGAFKGVSTLASVTFGSGLTEIGTEAFYGCNEMTDVSISAAVTSIGEAAFAACEKLISIRVNVNNSNYRSTPYLNGAGEVLFDRTQEKLVQYPAGILQSTYEIPTSVKTIGKRAFEGAMHLSVIEFPNTLTKIEEKAFYNTVALVTVRFGRGITYIGDQAFAGIITPLNAAIFYGAAPDPLSNQPNTSSNYFGLNVFQGALPTFKVSYLAGATGFPASGANWASYNQVTVSEISDFEFDVLSNNTIEITGYTGLAPTITKDRSTLPTPNIVVPDRAARLALTDTNTSINNRLPSGTLALQQDEDLIYELDYIAILGPVWTVYDNSGARFSLPAATALGTVVLEQDGVSKVYYQKVSNPGVVASNWIVVDFRIPNTLSGLKVTAIAAGAFENNTVINSVVLPSTLTKIGDKAFSGCTNLGGLVSGATAGGLFLPASVTNFGAGAFSSCNQLQQIIAHPSNPAYASQSGVLFDKLSTKLVQFPAGLARTSYVFPQSVTEIAPSAFAGSMFLAEINLPNSITTVGAEAFAGSQALAKVVFGTGVASLGNSTFSSISSLSEAVFFGKAPVVGSNVFASASGDFKVYYLRDAGAFPTANNFPSGDSGTWNGYPAQALNEFNDFEFTKVTGGVRIDGYNGDPATIRFESDLIPSPGPNQVVEDATARESLPAGLPIGWNVLELSTNLLWFVESQTGASAGQPARNNWAVRVSEGSRLLLDTTIPVGQTYKEQSQSEAMFYQKVAMPGTNESDWIRISNHTLRIPETIAGLDVVSIKEEAFKGLTSLESVIFPNSLKSIGKKAFDSCSTLGLPDGFAGNNRGIFIPAGVSSIGAGAFASCGWLSEIRVSAANKAYSQTDGVLFNKSQTQLLQYPGGRFNETYTLPSRITTIADYAFAGTAYLENVEIPTSCTDIGEGTFQGSLSLATIVVGSGVKRIGDLAFANISSLESITFKGNAPSLSGSNVFQNLPSSSKIQFNARSTGFNVAPWTSLNLVPVWMSEGSPTSAGFRAVGYVEPASFNNNIGGQIQLAVSRSRIVSGVLMLGSSVSQNGLFPTATNSSPAGAMASYRFKGEMGEDGSLSVTIPRRGQSDLELNLKFDLLQAPVFFKLNADSVLTDGTLLEDGTPNEAPVVAAMIPWSRTLPAGPFAGTYNMAFDADSGGQPIAPGLGFAGLTVDARTGAARVVGVLGDGTRITGASWVLGDGTIPLWFPLYNNRGMLIGDLDLGEVGNTFVAELLWTKPAGVPRSPDPDGFTDVLLTAAAGSGRYVSPAVNVFNNLILKFRGESASGVDFDQAFTVTNGRIVPKASNPYLIQAAWNLRGGLVQGTFSQPEPNSTDRPINRVGRFQAIILSTGEIYGNFVLPNSATRPTEFYGGSVQK